MKKKSYKGSRCEKRSMSKCADKFVRTYNAIESKYAEKLQENPDVKEFRCQVLLEGLEIGEYCSDFVATKTDGDLMVRECVYRKHLSKPMTAKLLDASRNFWRRRGVTDWGIVIEKRRRLLMEKNQLIRCERTIYRVLAIEENNVLLIDCIKKSMPKWYEVGWIEEYEDCTEEELSESTGMELADEQDLGQKARRTIHERFTVIAGILPFIDDERIRVEAIKKISKERGISEQTVRNYLCQYLVYQSISALVPKERTVPDRDLTEDEKNFRWALNKFYFTRHKNSLKTAYTYMLKERYCDSGGNLLPEYPSFNQFRYFHSKYKTQQNTIISRHGIKEYQRNYRPLLGDGVQSFAPNVGTGMIDATICDIYLVDNAGNIVGRPVLTIVTDSFSSGYVMGYSLTWEGGTYSLRDLMLNVIADKVEWCKKFGILIERKQWDSDKLPGVIVSDMGSEYKSDTFAQITELGVTLVNLPPLRPELKSIVEKSFHMLQESTKPYLYNMNYFFLSRNKSA